MSIPDIRRDSRGWFQFFDRDRSGRLDQGEVINAFVTTFGGTCDPNVLANVVQQLWPLFDRDGSGVITDQEFLARGGLCETMLAQFPAVEQQRQQYPEYGAPVTTNAPPVRLHCWSCHNQSAVQPPPGNLIYHQISTSPDNCVLLLFVQVLP